MDDGRQQTGGRERLLSVALDLFLDAGYDGVSMQQIADAAAMTKGAPYHHFCSKEELFGQALGRHFDRIHAGLMAELAHSGGLREHMIDGLAYLIAHTDAGMVRLVDDLRRLVGAERMIQYGATLDRLRECNRQLFLQAAANGVAFACTPEQAAELFLAVEIGELSLKELQAERSDEPGAIRPRAAWIVDALLRGVLEREPARPAGGADAEERDVRQAGDERC